MKQENNNAYEMMINADEKNKAEKRDKELQY
jgi:hypothetical protein